MAKPETLIQDYFENTPLVEANVLLGVIKRTMTKRNNAEGEVTATKAPRKRVVRKKKAQAPVEEIVAA